MCNWHTVDHELEIGKMSPLKFFLIFTDQIAPNLPISELQTKLKYSNYNQSYAIQRKAFLKIWKKKKIKFILILEGHIGSENFFHE